MGFVTNSEMTTFRRCEREWSYAYGLGYRPVERAPALEFGTSIHAALERRLNGIAPAVNALGDPYETERARAMIAGYCVRWASDGLEPLAVEVQFKTETFGGKLDGVVRDARGDVYVIEHKCLAGDTRVFDHSQGRFTTLKDLCDEGRFPILTGMAQDGTIRKAEAKVPIAQPARTTVIVRSATGRKLRASDNHPFFTTRGWVPAGDLKVGDWLASPRHIPSETTGLDVPDEAIRIIGYMIGDGCMSNMSFTKANEDVLSDVVSCAKKLGETPNRHEPKDRVPVLRFSKVGPVAKWLNIVGLRGGSEEKRVPQGLAMSDRQCGQLIGALWSTDGCIDTFGGRKPRIIYTSVSRELCADIQEILQRLGITSSMRQTSVLYKGARRSVYTTQVVSRASKRRFVSLAKEGVIGLTRSSVDLDAFVSAIPVTPQKSDESMQPRACDTIWWDKVESIYTGEPEVLYDVEVPGLHTFVANGIITHNTSSSDITPGSHYWSRLRLDTQVSLYLVGARSLGYDVRGVIYDVLKKPAVSPMRATPEASRRFTKDGRLYANQRDVDESPEEYAARVREAIASDPDGHYQRSIIVRLETEEVESELDAKMVAKRIDVARVAFRVPRNPDACWRYNRMCPYFAVCTGESSIENRALYTRVDNVHQELAT